MRLDIITIFPEYLDPLRHALLGKAIEQGILSIGVHNLRDWASGNHKAVDDSPLGGGPGMVMLPEVWGQALDHVAQLSLSGDVPSIESATAHRNDKARHDDVAAVPPRPYIEVQDCRDGEDAGAPLLLVPTPAGTPFTQADARAWSREEHIVVACGRYEGIDQRVFEDAARRYRVREVSIGDYVLIGGEVAALVIAEAVTRLIPGVLGNTESHEEDSFSDGLLEGPSYTKPRQWRGIAVPDVLLSGDHGKIARWHRDQSLLRTQQVRPELVDKLREEDALDRNDLFTLDARDVTTDIAVIMNTAAWEKAHNNMVKTLRRAGLRDVTVEAEIDDQACMADNAVVTQYLQAEDGPLLDPVYRIVVRGRTALSLSDVTRAVVDVLPGVRYWYGSTVEQ